MPEPASLLVRSGYGASGYGAAISRFAAERPEAPAYAVSGACWAALLLAWTAPASPLFCIAGARLFSGLSFGLRGALAEFQWPFALSHWLLMIGAMMVPMTAAALRFVALRSFRERRARATGLFLFGYVAIWLAVAPLYLVAALATHVATGGSPLLPLAVAFGLAAAWQASAAKQRALRLCHRTAPLPPSGRRADLACLRFGIAHGRYCVASCWALMLIPAASGHHPALMLAAAAAAIAERMGPMGLPDRTAGPLAAAGLFCLLLWVM
jgi:predicted metal-binding membrane protein